MVRVSSAHALARLGPSSTADAALTHAIDYDESPDVRREALLAVGARGVIAAAPLARSRLVDRIETDPVRSAAALSLGLLCDRDSADVLTEQALKLASPVADESERRVAESSLVALGWMKPPDLGKRLAPLTNQKMPGPIRRLAGAAIASKSHCEGPRARGQVR
jgi:HEAT repeat protein